MVVFARKTVGGRDSGFTTTKARALRLIQTSASRYTGNDFTHLLVFTGRRTEEKFMPSGAQSVSKKSLWAGRIISTLLVLFLLFDAVAKLMRIGPVLQAFTQLGFSTSLAVPIGAVLLVCTILYVLPPTSILGALLLTAYLGGATVTHLRAGQPFYFPIIFGVLVWGGLYLREDRLRALLPLRSPKTPSEVQ
jgi:DoxX-like family